MSEFGIVQLVGAIIGAITAVMIAGIIRLLQSNRDIDY